MQALADLLSSSLAQRIGWALIHFLWQGTLVALMLAVAVLLLPRRSAQVRWLLACITLGLMTVLPIVTAYMVSPDSPDVGRIEPLAKMTPSPDAVPSAAGEDELPSVAVGDPALPVIRSGRPSDGVALASTTSWLQQAKAFLDPVLPWGVLVWFLGVVGMSVWHLGGWLMLQKTKRSGTHPVAPAIRDIFDRLLQRLRISQPIRLLESARVAVPVVVGWFRPVILLPVSALSGLTSSQLEAVLAHELAHIHRFDCLVRLIQAVVETLLFYHPAVWWVSSRIRQESEYCCDELAVEICPDRTAYAHALAKVAELSSRRPRLAAAAGGGQLLPRICRILGLTDTHAGGGARWLAAVLIIACVITPGFVIHDNLSVEKVSVKESIGLLCKRRSSERAELIKQVLAKADQEPAFRTELINRLTKLISSCREDYSGANEVRALRELNAVEALPCLRKRWDRIAKKTYCLESADPRIQLLKTIAQLLPEKQRIQFLIDTQKDVQEAPKVRFRATILLCASGNDRGIQHVFSAYEQAKREYTSTIRMAVKDQAKRLRRKQEWDQDADMLNDYHERGMLVDSSNMDTDGDGIIDGNDRNPLCALKEEKKELRSIARLLFYLYTKRASPLRSPFPFKVWIVQTVDTYDGKGRPSMFDGTELTAVDGVVLHMGPDDVKKYLAIHGYVTPVIGIHELNDTEKSGYVKLLGEEISRNTSLRMFSLSESVSPSEWTSWLICVKRVHGVWLPVYWEMTMMT